MGKKKRNYLLERVLEIMRKKRRGKVLDLGCGDGDYGNSLKNMGFDVLSADIDYDRFKYHKIIPFVRLNIDRELPFPEGEFDYVLFIETIEHIYNPDFVIGQIRRVLKLGGVLILSTPNILNLNSRLRFLFQGSFDFFREPTLDYARVFPGGLQNMHVIPWRYQELEYLLYKNNILVRGVYTDLLKHILKFPWFMLSPMIKLSYHLKERRTTIRNSGFSYKRIHKILLSRELLFGRHLIIVGEKVS
ncbi:MAG TPA: methyltransferase domain-containing protein [Candidatus Omnitrophica bacterium]|nr:MAG: hypothetical protein DRP80_05570 [Candidatus Omnitrophota bacterium]HEC68755.1 methyltransferase domain-containing protein [Candidatus Omnitrophota bacterium]